MDNYITLCQQAILIILQQVSQTLVDLTVVYSLRCL